MRQIELEKIEREDSGIYIFLIKPLEKSVLKCADGDHLLLYI